MIPRAVAGAVLVFALLPCLLSAPPAEAPQFSLPDGVTPRRYALELTIDPRQPTFRGRVSIDVEVDTTADVVWLHAKDLQVRQAAIAQGGRTASARAKTDSGEFLALTPARPLVPGTATITIEYTGRMDGRTPEGIYRRRVDGQWYAYSTFTPIEARRAFPSFDEPRFKTPWGISLRVRSTDRAFSNAPVASETTEPGGWKRIAFAETQPLPTELVAIGVGPFDVLESQGVRVITTKGRAAEGQLAADSAAEIVRRLAEYTGIPYPFVKLDLLTVLDLQFAAVETPGLITFREQGFLTTPDAATPNRREAIEDLEAHEFAHQWFGNLVTQAGWQDTWLSEGFATWLGRKILGDESGAIEFRDRLMRQDEEGKSRVVRQPARSRADASDIYNRVIYEKGAAALIMLEGWIGEERFRDALRNYLQVHAFGNASTADLVATLPEPQAGAVVDGVLNTAGVPIVAAELDCEDEPELKIATTLGPIPVCWRSDLGAGCQVIETRATVELPAGSGCPTWLYLNSGGTGYYRTLWDRVPEAALPHLTSAERLTLAFDLRSTHAPGWRNLLETLTGDADPAVAAAARDGLR